MFTVEKAKKILSLIEGIKPELKFCNVNIVESNKFALKNIIN